MRITYQQVERQPDGLLARRLQHAGEEGGRTAKLEDFDLQNNLFQPGSEHLWHDVLIKRHLSGFTVEELSRLMRFYVLQNC